MRSNTKTPKSSVKSVDPILPSGGTAAVQSDFANLKRLVLTTLLFENSAYQSGNSVINDICKLIPKVDTMDLVQLAIESRIDQGLRHVPLFVAKEMLKHAKHRASVPGLLKSIIKRADEPAEFLAMLWADKQNPANRPKMPVKVRKALSEVLTKFDTYQLTKYLGRGNDVTLADVVRLTHPTAPTQELNETYRQIVMNEAAAADTWNKRLSLAKNSAERLASWNELIDSGNLPSMALLRNIRNLSVDGVSPTKVADYISKMSTRFINPLIFYAGYIHASDKIVKDAIDKKFIETMTNRPKLKGKTVTAVDFSGSMNTQISSKSDYKRVDVAVLLSVATSLMSEDFALYATADSHKCISNSNKLSLKDIESLKNAGAKCGWGGIYTRQAMDFMRKDQGSSDRVLVISDSQDCERGGNTVPDTSWANNSYIIDVSAHTLGVNYSGVWTSEISGWTDKFLDYVLALEGLQVSDDSED